MRDEESGARYGRGFGNVRATQNINVTNITNVTNMMGVTHERRGKPRHWGKRKRHGGGRHERPPKMWEFCSSCGLLGQQNLPSSSEEGIVESAKAIKYGAGKLTRTVGGMAGHTANAAFGLGRIAMNMVGLGLAMFNICRSKK